VISHPLTAVIAAAALAGAAGAACAQVDLLSPETVHGLVDVRIAAADGEASFVDGGFGKTLYGGTNDGGWRAQADLTEVGLEWRPRFTWELSAVVEAIAQPGQAHDVDLLEAYLAYKPVPRSATSFSARLGFFYPPISLENDAPFWGVTNTITPSAINSWVGEEVKVVGLEGTVAHDFASSDSLRFTAAVFGYDDTAGTLLSYRGWALDDLKATAFGEYDLPALSPFAAQVQDDETYSTLQIDHRPGWYARLEWQPLANLTLDAFHYDNRGDKITVNDEMQWAWDTRFTDLGLTYKIDDRTKLLAQALTGRTQMGFETPQGLYADVTFRAAYGLLTRDIGPGALTGRLDIFQVVENSFDDNAEHGWAATGAYRLPIGAHADLRFEALHVWSDRPSRVFGGLDPTQAQTVLQSALRLFF
jgi:hypothetical protein